MGLNDTLLAAAFLAVAEAHVLKQTVYPNYVFRNLYLVAFGVNIFLKFIVYNIFIYPFFLNPLRHLPKPRARITALNRNLYALPC